MKIQTPLQLVDTFIVALEREISFKCRAMDFGAPEDIEGLRVDLFQLKKYRRHLLE